MKVLITGVTGVVGKNLFHIFKQKNLFDLYCTGRSNCELLNYIQIDLTDSNAVMRVCAVHEFDVIIHCAACIFDKPSYHCYSNNVIAMSNILNAALMSNVKHFYHISSVSVIGKILSTPIKEEHEAVPLSDYALSKYHCEHLTKKSCEGKIQYMNLRIPSPVGKFMPPRSVFPIFLERISSNLDVTLLGDRNRKMSFLDLRDLANLLMNALINQNVSGTFNVSSSTSYSNRELAEMLIRKTDSTSRVIDLTDELSDGINDWRLCCAKAKLALGYSSSYSLDDTLNWILEEKVEA